MLTIGDFDCELHDWVLVMHPTPIITYPTIVGIVRKDKKGRFADGRAIRTSALLSSPEQLRAGAIVVTLNTRYLLGPAGQRH